MRRADRPNPVPAGLTTLALVMPLAVVALATPALAAPGDLARTGTATASQFQSDADGTFPPDAAIDADPATRWASGNGPDEDVPYAQWVQVDLGAEASVDHVVLAWEAAFAAGYEVQVATTAPDDPASWTAVHAEEAGDGGTDDVTFAATDARYVRVHMTQRTSFDWDPARPHWYGYSLFSFEVYGTATQTAVAFARSTTTVRAGETATVPLILASAAEADATVRVRSTGGTGVAGTDYTAVDETVTFPAGSTEASVSVPTVDHGPLGQVRTVELTLSEPSDALVLGGRTSTSVTIAPHGELPDVGGVTVLDDFESGVPAGYTTWGASAPVTPVLSTGPVDRGGNGLIATVGAEPAAGDWFGFTHDIAATDWSAHDGFTFWFLGTGEGGELRYELKSGGQLFERSVTDDTAGWRQVSVAFSQLRLKGTPASDARFDPSASTGFAVTLTDLGAGAWAFDDLGLYDRVSTIEDAEGEVPLAEPGSTVGIFTWGSAADLVRLGVTEQEREGLPADNHVLSGDYQIPSGGWGGFSQNLAAGQDWSSFRGIRLAWYASQPTRPASPTAGDDIKVELKDGGPDGEHSEVWAATFKDNWSSDGSRWKIVDLPFSQFTLSGYQPGDAATRNGTLDLTSAWGYAITMVPGTATTVSWAVDDVQLYGSAVPAPTATVDSDDVVLVDPGATAQVPVVLTTTDGQPLPADVTVDYANGAGTAEAGTHYDAFSGTLTFPAGAASGSAQTIEVVTHATDAVDDARTLTVDLSASGAAVGTTPRVVLNAVGAPYLDASRPTDERVDDLLGRMTLAEKVGQMTQAERLGLQSPTQIADLGLGSVLSGGGSVPAQNTAAGWADMVDAFQRQALSTRLQIPLIYGVDAVHGHNNVVGATIFPHNEGLGAARDADLVEQVQRTTAQEVRATGVPWTFAPCLCVTRDERWGRSYESFGEDPALVTAMAGAAVVGLQGTDPSDLSGPDKVLATAKHWVGDGGTTYDPALAGSGYPIDQGVTHVESLDELRRLHVDPYVPALDAGVGSIMPSYSAVSVAGADPIRMHEHGALNTDLLKGELGFDGFLISDWEGIDKLPGGTYADKAARSVNAGLDMAMAPYNFGAFITAITDKVGSGDVAQERVDDAVRRILTQKFALGLFDVPFADRSLAADVGSDAHRAVAREAAGKSQVLLKNTADLLPLAADTKLYVAGSNADDLGNQAGGWTISWQGGSGDITPGTSILEGIQAANPAVTYSEDASAPVGDAQVGVVVVGETPYAEGQGDVGNNGKSLSLSAADRAAIDTVCGALECVVLVVSGRPQLVTDQLGDIDALVASWLPGTEGAGVADVLFGTRPFTGRLPVSWPAAADQVPVNVGDETYAPLYPYGWGLRTDAQRDRLTALAGTLTGDAQAAVQAVLDAPIWAGSALDPARTAQAVRLLFAAAEELNGTERDTAAAAGTVVSLVRDLAQAASGPDDAATTADAEHALMSGDASGAVDLLADVLGVSTAPPVASTTTLSLSSPVVAFGNPVTARVTVKAPGGAPAGTVQVLVDGTPVATATLTAAGTASVRLPADVATGRHRVTAVYAGAHTADPPVTGSTSAAATLTVTKTLPSVRTDGTDWTVGRSDPKVVLVQVAGVAGVTPTGTVDVWVNGSRRGSATLDARGSAEVTLPAGTRTSLVLVTYAGDRTYLPWIGAPRLLVVR
ncbi:glycoside hydrolase family 3 N-terminal domain-containing protein [Cellulomonas fengjieae]|uniref:glycoside hydrolase family 3 N-terminal domain-containing protein n=1 Tax=Cellulomonas fengjieae TaxID=2819978 RepID=UPI001AAF8AA4|nr:glycoside hydrolase family 3 N-terminal domain-containing protein [Cellulomonas fengjieae]MBO3100774.1 glycoside hydrolase family 3 C-terminal domain-containing protein [Cellulomonas fengjieae]